MDVIICDDHPVVRAGLKQIISAGQSERRILPSQDQRLSIPSEGAMKVQTDVKAGGGLLGILIDIDIDIDLGGGCACGRKKRSHRRC